MRFSTLVAAALVTLVAPASAHHGFGEFDETKVVTLTGVVESLKHENPHSAITLRAGADVWSLVLPSAAGFERFGLTAETFAVGATVTVKGYLHKKVKLTMRPEWLVRDGKNVQISVRTPRQPPPGQR